MDTSAGTHALEFRQDMYLRVKFVGEKVYVGTILLDNTN